MKKFGRILLILIVIALILAIAFITVNFAMSKVNKKANPLVKIEFEGYGTVEIELYPDMAPNTVKNFIRLAQRGYYDGKTITDIEDGLIRGGLVTTTNEAGESVTEGAKISNIKDLAEGEEDKAYSIEGEFIQNGFNENTLSHSRGVISMYRSSYGQYQQEFAMVQMMGYGEYADTLYNELYNSQSSGFFILTEDNTGFDGTFTAFGKVKKGMEVVDAISKIELQKTTNENGVEETSTKPVTAPIINKVTVDPKGVDYGMPEYSEAFDFDAVFNMFMSSYMSSSGTTTSY